jgi:hypothetical protein
MKPCRFPINISSNTSNSSGIRLIDLLDSPILWPSNQASYPIFVFWLDLLLNKLQCFSF